jgi:hypothetical protein
MRCSEFTEMLGRVLDGEGAPGEAGEVEAHLARCPSCRAEYHPMRDLLDLLKDDPVPEPPEGYWDSFLPRLRTRIHRRSLFDRLGGRARWAFATPVAVTALVALFAFGILKGNPSWTGESLLEVRLAGQLDHFVETGGNVSVVAPENPLWPDDTAVDEDEDYSAIVAETRALEQYFDSIDDLGAGEDMYSVIRTLSEESRNELLKELAQSMS